MRLSCPLLTSDLIQWPHLFEDIKQRNCKGKKLLSASGLVSMFKHINWYLVLKNEEALAVPTQPFKKFCVI